MNELADANFLGTKIKSHLLPKKGVARRTDFLNDQTLDKVA